MSNRKVQAFNAKLKKAQALFFVRALIWLGRAAAVLYDMAVINNNRLPAILVGIFMLGNAAMMFVSGILLGRRQMWVYYFAAFVLVVNIILAFTDRLGFWNLLSLIVDLILFVILLSIRKPYLSKS